MAVTLRPMGKKLDTTKTATVRISEDLAKKLRLIVAVLEEDAPKLLSDHLRPLIEKKYAEAKKKLAQED